MENDTIFSEAYNDRKLSRQIKRRAKSEFNYNTAGGNYIPTKIQYDFAMKFLLNKSLSEKQKNAANMVILAYSCNEKTHHDHIHIINEMIRNETNI
jgi:hypothetical protein